MRVLPTIVAPASGQGRAGIAVICVSGPRAKDSLVALTGKTAPSSHGAVAAICGPADE